MGWHGRYGGQRMTVYAHILPGAESIARWMARTNISEEAKSRLKILDWFRSHEHNISLTARHLGLERKTVRRWLKRFQTRGLLGLNSESRRPRRFRHPTTPWQVVQGVVDLRNQYPAWSKYKIMTMLAQKGMSISASTVGRILKRKGLIDKKVTRRRRKAALHPKARFPHGLKISRPGDLIQVDTKYIMLVGGRKLYQFTAIDVLSKIRVLDVYASQSSRNGARFLEQCIACLPFPIGAVQSDNGSPFLKEFERVCTVKCIPHYFIYPRNPKQNSYVEISHGADEREFYQQGNTCSDIERMRVKLKNWMHIWNEVRPHQALNYLTPAEYIKKWQDGRLPTKDVITLQT